MAVTKITESFSEKKQTFNNYLHHPYLFDCAEFNILKLFQYALFREEGFTARPFWKLPSFLISILFFIKRLKIRKPQKITPNSRVEIIIYEPYQIVINKNNQALSKYLENILQSLSGEKTIILNVNWQIKNISSDSSTLVYKEYYDYLSVSPLTQDDVELLKALRKTYKKIQRNIPLNEKKKKIFEEVIQIFWQQYRVTREIIKHYPSLKVALMQEHYQNEGMYLALKRQGIKIIELQHGLISEKDMFYVYSSKINPIREKCLFGDEIWVYGEYWKNVLLKGSEYTHKQIKILGYYLYEENDINEEFQRFQENMRKKHKNILLFTAQKNLEHHLAEYINWLCTDLSKNSIPQTLLIIKPHPRATQNIQQFIRPTLVPIQILDYPLNWLFQLCTHHISIYSTTLYDALRYNIQHNYALNIPLFADYVDDIVQTGIAIKLEPYENPLRKQTNSTAFYPPSYYFDTFSKDTFLKLLNTHLI